MDTQQHLIVAHEVSMAMGDHRMLTKMSIQARETTGINDMEVIADRDYFAMEEIKSTVDVGITPYVPKTVTSTNRKMGLYDRRNFIYVEAKDENECPAGERLPRQTKPIQGNMLMYRYWSKNCGLCSLKPKCSIGKERRVIRWENDKVIETHERRTEENPTMMRLRKQTAEHPFGTIKSWMGMTHFKTKRLRNIAAEMSLHVLTCNITRMINIMGVKPLIRAIEA